MATTQTTSNVLAGVTLGGSAMEWLAANSSALTVIIVFTTGVGSLILSWWGKRCENRIGEERNRVNRRDITMSILNDLKHGKDSDLIVEIEQIIKNR